jgi:hypothetical protein
MIDCAALLPASSSSRPTRQALKQRQKSHFILEESVAIPARE